MRLPTGEILIKDYLTVTEDISTMGFLATLFKTLIGILKMKDPSDIGPHIKTFTLVLSASAHFIMLLPTKSQTKI